MAFGTKLNLSDSKSEQLSGQTLSLSGNTHIYGQFIVNSGATLSILPNHGNGKVLTSDSGGIATWQQPVSGSTGTTWGNITGVLSGQTDLQLALNAKLDITTFNIYTGETYNLGSPSICPTGGMCAGTTLTGKTAFEILKEILAPELCGTLTSPSVSISLSPSTLLYEIGSSISTLCVTGTFNQGCINPQYCSTSPKRSGLANCYKFAGCGVVGSYACTTSPVTKCATGYTICASQTWQVCTCYDVGVQPKGNTGSNFSSPLPAGCVCSPVCTITGIYPYYFGKSSSGSRPVVDNSLVTGGTKCVLNAGTCTSVIFGAVGEWTWFAIPAACAARAYWCETALSRGTMATGPTDKYPDTCTLNISSGQGCWSTISYNVYISGTVGTIGTIALSSYLIP